jgi:hypothetical protein
MLEKVRFRDYDSGIDIEAFTDGYAYDEYSCVYLLSVSGHDSNVKAVTSALVTGRTVEISSDEPVTIGTSYRGKYRVMSSKLPSMLLHQVVAEEGFFKLQDKSENLLYAGEGDPVRLVYEAVRTGYPAPLIAEWSGWLYRTLRKEGCVAELKGNKKVLRLSVDEGILDSLISAGVSSGEISF